MTEPLQIQKNKHLLNLGTHKINCDKIINNYLELSLSPKIKDQVEQTKTWLKCNKKYAKSLTKEAERKLRKALNANSIQTLEVFSPDANSITSLMMAATGKIVPKKLFNEHQMQRVIVQKQKKQNTFLRKSSHNKKIDNYLKLISKLQKQSLRKEQNGKSSQCNFVNKQNMQPNQEKFKYILGQAKKDLKQEIKKINSIGNRNTSKYRINKQKTDLSNYTSLNSSKIRQQISLYNNDEIAITHPQIKYHPFLERNLGMLYEPKRKTYKKSKFDLKKNEKNGSYF